ncbi:hypothetical protein BSNK01_30870 [Bacillaceae bacterium]
MTERKTPTGIAGLDDVLYGGLPPGAAIILEGTPGSGKTTLACQFLYHGAKMLGESGLYVTFEELPAQLYTEMGHFGWDLRELEKNGRLRVMCLSPEILIEEMLEPHGLFDQIVDEIECKRIVIDSMSLFQYGLHGEDEHRKVIYRLRNILRKKGLTSLLIREQYEVNTNIVPFEHFVADGVIRLQVKPYRERFRERTLEVLKMRGQKFLEGEHVYRITDHGIHVIPALHVLAKNSTEHEGNVFSTSIPVLDQILGGGILEGAVYMFDTNSKSEYKHLFGAIVTAQFKQGRKGIILPSTTLNDLDRLYRKHGMHIQDLIDRKSLYFIEHYERPCPPGLSPGVIDVSKIDNDSFIGHLRKTLGPVIEASLHQGDSWFAYYDLNTIISERGKNFVTKYFAQQAANARAQGITLFVLCNFKEVGEEVASFLERISDVVIRTWVDHTYQYLQVTKLPGGHVSDIQIVEHIPEEPYVRLV